MSEITYAKVDGPPADWRGLRVVNDKNGREIRNVIEVNAAQGWLIRCRQNRHGEFILKGDHVAKERLRGRFRIERMAEATA